MKVIIFDFEVFKYNTLLGCYILKGNDKQLFQTWDLKEIKEFYNQNKNSIWIGHNNSFYDNFILQGIINNKNEEELKILNDDIIDNHTKYNLNIQLYSYDLIVNHFGSLKSIEAVCGKNISESEVDFNLDRALTEEEKKLTESYNRDDLNQTLEDFEFLFDEFQLRIEMIKEFNLDLDCISLTGTQIAEKILDARKVKDIEYQVIKPKMYDNLIINNQPLIDYYLKEKFKTEEKLEIEICGVKHNIGNGGIHGAREKVMYPYALYLDVSGYYNLIMLLFDLLPRSMSEEGKQLYDYMYHEQLKLKGKPELAGKRAIYKTTLLAVFGAMKNKYCKFFDIYKGDLVTITGELFIVDLLEKLEGKIELIQSNTDGIIVYPLATSSEEEIINIVKEWCERTGFVIKPKKIYNIVQRDVNNYLYQDEEGNIEVKGEALKHYKGDKNPFKSDIFNAKEPFIIAKAIVNYFIYDIPPEKTIEDNKTDLQAFQFICKKLSYDYVEYEETNIYEFGSPIISKKMQNVNRVFASNSKEKIGMIYKFKYRNGKLSKSRFASLPDNIFVYNNEIISNDATLLLSKKINYNYYIKRAYERILEFMPDE